MKKERKYKCKKCMGKHPKGGDCGKSVVRETFSDDAQLHHCMKRIKELNRPVTMCVYVDLTYKGDGSWWKR